jgi:uncharacterized damage-inducible protein DinB
MDHNEQVRQELLASVSGLSDELLNKRVEEESWTIMQVLEHLYLIEMYIANMIADTLANGSIQPVKEKPIHLTVNRSKKVQAPSFSIPSDQFMTLEEMQEKLHQSRQLLMKVSKEAIPSDLEQKSFPHPAFGPISLKQWISFVGYHEKRHLAQIEELKAKL